jgi:tetratricopeptide (TPR) repeat protein
VEKHPVTPGPILPARELEGDLLLELGRPAEALAAYEATLGVEPRRARALAGAARAAEAAGDHAAAERHYRSLLEVMEKATADRAALRDAREFLAKR